MNTIFIYFNIFKSPILILNNIIVWFTVLIVQICCVLYVCKPNFPDRTLQVQNALND